MMPAFNLAGVDALVEYVKFSILAPLTIALQVILGPFVILVLAAMLVVLLEDVVKALRIGTQSDSRRRLNERGGRGHTAGQYPEPNSLHHDEDAERRPVNGNIQDAQQAEIQGLREQLELSRADNQGLQEQLRLSNLARTMLAADNREFQREERRLQNRLDSQAGFHRQDELAQAVAIQAKDIALQAKDSALQAKDDQVDELTSEAAKTRKEVNAWKTAAADAVQMRTQLREQAARMEADSQQIRKLTSRVAEAERQTVEAQRRTAEVQGQRVVAERQRTEAEWQCAEVQKQLAEVQRQTSEAKRQRAVADGQRTEAKKQCAEVQRQLAEAQRQTSEAKRQRAVADGQRTEAKKQCAEVQRQLAEAQRQTSEAKRQRAVADGQRTEAKKQCAEVQKQLAEAQKQTAEAKGQRAVAERQRTEAEKQCVEVQKQLAEAQRHIAEVERQRAEARKQQQGELETLRLQKRIASNLRQRLRRSRRPTDRSQSVDADDEDSPEQIDCEDNDGYPDDVRNVEMLDSPAPPSARVAPVPALEGLVIDMLDVPAITSTLATLAPEPERPASERSVDSTMVGEEYDEASETGAVKDEDKPSLFAGYRSAPSISDDDVEDEEVDDDVDVDVDMDGDVGVCDQVENDEKRLFRMSFENLRISPPLPTSLAPRGPPTTIPGPRGTEDTQMGNATDASAPGLSVPANTAYVPRTGSHATVAISSSRSTEDVNMADAIAPVASGGANGVAAALQPALTPSVPTTTIPATPASQGASRGTDIQTAGPEGNANTAQSGQGHSTGGAGAEQLPPANGATDNRAGRIIRAATGVRASRRIARASIPQDAASGATSSATAETPGQAATKSGDKPVEDEESNEDENPRAASGSVATPAPAQVRPIPAAAPANTAALFNPHWRKQHTPSQPTTSGLPTMSPLTAQRPQPAPVLPWLNQHHALNGPRSSLPAGPSATAKKDMDACFPSHKKGKLNSGRIARRPAAGSPSSALPPQAPLTSSRTEEPPVHPPNSTSNRRLDGDKGEDSSGSSERKGKGKAVEPDSSGKAAEPKSNGEAVDPDSGLLRLVLLTIEETLRYRVRVDDRYLGESSSWRIEERLVQNLRQRLSGINAEMDTSQIDNQLLHANPTVRMLTSALTTLRRRHREERAGFLAPNAA